MASETSKGVTGSLGPVVYYFRKGKKCMRTKTQDFHDAATPTQLKHREKIRRSAQFLRTSIKAINIGYQDTDKDSPSNEARSFLVKNCFIETASLPVLDFSKVMVSRGFITAPQNSIISKDDKSLVITWDVPKKGEKLNVEDDANIVMYSDDSKEGTMHFLRNVALRKDGAVTLPIPYRTAPLHIWMFFSCSDALTKESKSKISDSVYLGEI